MSEEDFTFVCCKIDENAEFLNAVSQEIWKHPELQFKEIHAHDTLTNALEHCGFSVQRNFVLPTAFKAEYSSQTEGGPTIAIVLEYDALPEMGHACGHNLIAEAGLAAGIAIKAVMEANTTVIGKLMVLGTPAEEEKGGKIQLLNAKVFDGVDAALMVHPAKYNIAVPQILAYEGATIDFIGREAHASAFPWEGRNALDAAVTCYQSLAFLRQQIRPSCKIHAIITKGGTRTNIIPAHTSIEIALRAPTMGQLNRLKSRILTCVTGAASSTGCTSTISYDPRDAYENLISNAIITDIYADYAEQLGLEHLRLDQSKDLLGGASTDMGNVSHCVPAMQPFFGIDTEATNHTKAFTEAAGSLKAQKPTLSAAKAMATTALKLFRCSKTLEKVKKQFEKDISEDARKGIQNEN